jgi:predicted nucleic acid-binding protein
MRRLVLDTDVASHIFKWHPLASTYLALIKNAAPVISFMTLAEMRFGALGPDGARQT